MDDDALLDRLCMERLKRKGYSFRKTSEEGSTTVEIIKHRVADYFGVRVYDLTSRKRSSNIVAARQVAIALCSQVTELSCTELAKEFGRTHAMVRWSSRAVAAAAPDSYIGKAMLDIRNGLR